MLFFFAVCVSARRLVEGIPTLDFFSFVMVDRGPGHIVELNASEFVADPPDAENLTITEDNFTLPPKTSASVRVNLSELELIYTKLELKCLGTGNSESHTCAVSINDAQDLTTHIGNTVSTDVKNTADGIRLLLITLTNDGETDDAVFELPTITLSRTGRWTDIEGVASEPLENHNKALVYTMPIAPEYGEIELETIRLEGCHEFPEFLLPINEEFGTTGVPFTHFPIIASDSTIIGMNPLNADILDTWSVVNYSDQDQLCFGMRIKANKPFTISYIVIDTSSVSIMDALEIWHHSFPTTYAVQKTGNGAWVNPLSNPLSCSVPYNERFEWGNGTGNAYENLLPFYPMKKFSVSIPVAPAELETCNQPEDVKKACQIVVDAGIRNDKKEYVYMTSGSTYTYEIGWSPNASDYLISDVLDTETIQKDFHGLAFDFYNTETVSWDVPEETVYSLSTDKGDLIVPMLSSMFRFAIAFQTLSPQGSLVQGGWIHPQLIWSVASAGISVKLAGSGGSYDYSDEERRRLWGLRYMLGSRPMTVIETSNVVNLLDALHEFCSVCMVLGAFPSLNLPTDSWMQCTLVKEVNDVFNTWGPTMAQVMRDTIYYPNMDGIVTVEYTTPPKGNNSFYETSMFCPEEEEEKLQITCFVSILLADRDATKKSDGYMSVRLTFKGDENPECALVSDSTTCTTSGHDVDIVMKGALIRTVTLSYKRNVSRSVETWVRENIWLLLLVFIVVIGLLIAMGFAIWTMFCRKRSRHEHLARIIDYERKQKRKKARLQKEQEELKKGKLRIEMSDGGSELTP